MLVYADRGLTGNARTRGGRIRGRGDPAGDGTVGADYGPACTRFAARLPRLTADSWDQTLNQAARRLVYQSVTGWGGRRRAVRAGSCADLSLQARSGDQRPDRHGRAATCGRRPGRSLGMTLSPDGDLFGIIMTPDGILAVNDETNAVDLFHG